jgi:hypothetical protein
LGLDVLSRLVRGTGRFSEAAFGLCFDEKHALLLFDSKARSSIAPLA